MGNKASKNIMPTAGFVFFLIQVLSQESAKRRKHYWAFNNPKQWLFLSIYIHILMQVKSNLFME